MDKNDGRHLAKPLGLIDRGACAVDKLIEEPPDCFCVHAQGCAQAIKAHLAIVIVAIRQPVVSDGPKWFVYFSLHP